MAFLRILEGPARVNPIELTQDVFVIGRSPDCDLVLPELYVSRCHARIMRVGDQFFIEELSARPRTWVNQERIRDRVELHDRDRIHIPSLTAEFILGENGGNEEGSCTPS